MRLKIVSEMFWGVLGPQNSPRDDKTSFLHNFRAILLALSLKRHFSPKNSIFWHKLRHTPSIREDVSLFSSIKAHARVKFIVSTSPGVKKFVENISWQLRHVFLGEKPHFTYPALRSVPVLTVTLQYCWVKVKKTLRRYSIWNIPNKSSVLTCCLERDACEYSPKTSPSWRGEFGAFLGR